MSKFLELASPDFPRAISEHEEFAHWGEEQMPFSPRRFRFGTLSLLLVTVPLHLRRWMSFGGSNQTCIEVSPNVVYDWSSQRVEPSIVSDVRRLFNILTASTSWVVAYESDRGEGVREITATPAQLFDCVDRLLQGAHDDELTIVMPAPTTDVSAGS